MPKRVNNIYVKATSLEALYGGYLRGRMGKRRKGAVARFEGNLGANLQKLERELADGSYRPRPYKQFYVTEPKRRLISAPHFRDVVVQHAIYALIYPIFDASFIHDNYGCRVGKGTHRAADQAQRFLRQVPAGSFTLQMDISKFYYRIDRDILRTLLAKKIKDEALLDLIMMFAVMEGPVGLPIGNLLSQLLALIYLDALDHYAKRELKCKRYVRYVDDFIVFGLESRDEANALRVRIETFLHDALRLSLSRYSIHPTRRGLNFVGFRTWRSTRFVRRHSLHTFSKALKKDAVTSMVSIMGNAKRSATYAHFCRRVKSERPHLLAQLPENHRHACI